MPKVITTSNGRNSLNTVFRFSIQCLFHYTPFSGKAYWFFKNHSKSCPNSALSKFVPVNKFQGQRLSVWRAQAEAGEGGARGETPGGPANFPLIGPRASPSIQSEAPASMRYWTRGARVNLKWLTGRRLVAGWGPRRWRRSPSAPAGLPRRSWRP